jgi:hypothetical protein
MARHKLRPVGIGDHLLDEAVTTPRPSGSERPIHGFGGPEDDAVECSGGCGREARYDESSWAATQ